MERKSAPTPTLDQQPLPRPLTRPQTGRTSQQQTAQILFTPQGQNCPIDFSVPNGLFEEYESVFFRHGIRKAIAAELDQYQRTIHRAYEDACDGSEEAPKLQTINEHLATKATSYLQRKIKTCLGRQPFEDDFAEAAAKWGELVSQEQAEHMLGLDGHTLNRLAREKSLTRVHVAAASRGFPRIFWLKNELLSL